MDLMPSASLPPASRAFRVCVERRLAQRGTGWIPATIRTDAGETLRARRRRGIALGAADRLHARALLAGCLRTQARAGLRILAADRERLQATYVVDAVVDTGYDRDT